MTPSSSRTSARDARSVRPRVGRVLKHNALFDALCAQVDLRPAPGLVHDGGAAFARARTTCLLCPASDACAAWLARPPAAGEPRAAPSFCPNREFFTCASADASEAEKTPD